MYHLPFNLKSTHRLETDESNPLVPIHYCFDCAARGNAELNAEPCHPLTPEERMIKDILE